MIEILNHITRAVEEMSACQYTVYNRLQELLTLSDHMNRPQCFWWGLCYFMFKCFVIVVCRFVGFYYGKCVVCFYSKD